MEETISASAGSGRAPACSGVKRSSLRADQSPFFLCERENSSTAIWPADREVGMSMTYQTSEVRCAPPVLPLRAESLRSTASICSTHAGMRGGGGGAGRRYGGDKENAPLSSSSSP